MSSLRNAAKRKAAKERSQPSNRKGHGLLEKHKDYVLRAKDYHAKQDKLKNLREKAFFKNPDEFYFRMISGSVEDGKHILAGSKPLSTEQKRHLKSQDISYITIKKTMESEKIKRIQANLHMLDEEPQNFHTYFVSEDDQDIPSDSIKSQKTSGSINPEKLRPEVLLKIEKARASQYRELAARLEREKKLTDLLIGMSHQKEMLSKGRKRKIESDSPSGFAHYKWKRERKK
mmetsp:Transcript_15450/g.26570  ORF Transcript_15450/g.26570 Transcript_15450/m.26570 type:complete len:231 (+) Transcript_15450:67-759(+)|eukprot:CAMPEP_0196659622 /NCGR_PEP_ID=MMETSP1086-20130531/35850_1 /TAXON_ID=77921 /ORGANISM="Cyanoptyche  gloeocystis , Strain SAG4.97" /LENGTH=230 /DNA_ID=CAMNT_0041993673 /DNA_START=48 /DNA_END=740 /DNA_ORIENTATION=+